MNFFTQNIQNLMQNTFLIAISVLLESGCIIFKRFLCSTNDADVIIKGKFRNLEDNNKELEGILTNTSS